MTALARKISRSKWPQGQVALDKIPADAITDLKTIGNTLSFWACENSPPGTREIEDTVLAIAAGADKIDKFEVAWLDEASLTGASLELTSTEGVTPVQSLRERHRDLVNLDYARLGVVAGAMQTAVVAGSVTRLSPQQVLLLVVDAVKTELVSLDALKAGVRVAVEKQIAKEQDPPK